MDGSGPAIASYIQGTGNRPVHLTSGRGTTALGMDRDLIRRVQSGDHEAFDSLILADYARLFRVAHGILRDRTRSEDATQQAYLDVWRNIRSLRDPASFEGWSYRLLVHACYAEARRMPRWLPETAVLAIREPVAHDDFSNVLDRDELERGFRALSVDHRAVVVLHYLLDMTLDQVAEALDIPRGTVYSRLSRAMDAMRDAMRADGARGRSGRSRQEAIT
jgi:RNA polymerase sigma-70 factor (ECF subfamily)